MTYHEHIISYTEATQMNTPQHPQTKHAWNKRKPNEIERHASNTIAQPAIKNIRQSNIKRWNEIR